MKSDIKKYYLFGLALFLFQIIGYNVITLGILALSLIPILSADEFINRIKDVPFFIAFLLLSIVVGFYFGIANGLNSWSIPYWGQFYFFCFALLAIKDKSNAFTSIKYCVYAIFIADIITNILLLAGFNLPWSELPPVRPGETMTRFTGVKGSTLYSGSITFIAICFSLQEEAIKKWIKYLSIACMVFNLFLSGSYRYFIICAVVIALYYFKLYKHRSLIFITYILSIIIVYFSTKITMFLSYSNFERFYIWNYYIGEIAKSPIFGHGFFNVHLDMMENWTVLELIEYGVTESCILLIAYCFGIPVLCFFLTSIAKTLYHFKRYSCYCTELGLFIGLSLDLFWGGSLDNSLSICVLLLSLYLINIKKTSISAKEPLKTKENAI